MGDGLDLIDLFQLQMIAELALALGVWPLLCCVFLIVGNRQSREGRGRAGRLWQVSMAAAALASLPMWIWLLTLLPPFSAETSFSFALGLTAVSAIGVGRHLARPVQFPGSRAALPLIDDEEFLARVRELSAKMGIDPPRVRLLGSVTDSLETMAYVGGLPAPVVIVTDGTMHRLDNRERDTVLAHELAHIATGSLWWHASLVPMGVVAASLASSFLPLLLAAGVGVAFFVGVKRVISRRFEIACDLCAGEAMGQREMASALVKIHTAHPFPNKGLLSFLTYATATHPPLATRLAALRAASPDGERDGIVTDSRAVLRHSIGSFVALLLWVAAIAGAVWLGQDQESISLALSILLGISISPILILLASIRKKLAVSSRRQGTSIRLVMLVYLVLLFLVVFAISPKDVDGRSVLPVVVLLILLVLILVPLLKWIQRPQADIVAAIREHDFQRAVELGEENPKRVRKDQNLRHNVAMARALCGDRQRAIDEMRQLVHDVPKFQQAALTLATFLLDEDPAEAMEVADRAAKKLKRDSGPLVIRARALRRLGRLQEADDVIGRAIELAPDDGTILAVAAQISLDLGDIERATELMDEAQRKTPGDAFCLMVRAELALASGTMEEAVDAVEKAAAAAGHNPLALLGGEIARLRRHPAVASRWGEADEVIWAEDAEER